MATTTRNELKQYFQKGKIPTQAHFEALIDSGLNQLDDRLRSSPNDPLTLLPSGPGEGLLGFSRVETNAGVESLKPTWLIRHEPAGSAAPGLLFQDARKRPALYLQNGTGNVGIGTTDPGLSRLKIAGPGADVAHVRFAYEGAGELEFAGWTQGWNINSKTPQKHLYLNRDAAGSSNIYIGTLGREITVLGANGNVGIGTADPAGKLQVVNGRVDITSSPTVALGGPRFNGLASELRRAQLVLSSEYSDLVIASGQRNYRHGSTLTFASFNPDDATVYRKWVINQGNWQDAGGRMGFLEFGYQDAVASNPHENINDERTVLTLDGANRRVGIGTTVPEASLHVVGDVILGELRLGPQGRMNSSMWRVTQVYNNQTGPLPLRTGVFDSGGGTLLIISSGSGWKAPPGAGWIGMGIQVDGTHYGSHGVFCNEANSHRAFATNPLVVRGIAAGRHTLSLVTTDATTDHNDRYSVTVIEFPF